MSLAIQTTPKTSTHQIIDIRTQSTRVWFPNYDQAYQDVLVHIASRASDSTPEQHTRRSYIPLLNRFIEFCNFRNSLPDETLMREYIAYLQNKYADSTVGKHLAVARHFIRALARQYINPSQDPEQRFALGEVRHSIRNAAEIKDPPKKIKTSVSPLYATGTRLSMEEAATKLSAIDPSTLKGLRDKAIILTFLTTGLRLAEVCRISLSAIEERGPGTFVVTVRAKGNKFEPRALPTPAYRAIMAYISAYNGGLADDDPRRIKPDAGLWRPITKTGRYYSKPRPSIGTRGMAKIIRSRLSVAVHDLRRTWAAWADQLGMDRKHIQQQMAHETFTQTDHYIGERTDFGAMDITRLDGFMLK